jgi:ATP-dependent Clp protease protease subunit
MYDKWMGSRKKRKIEEAPAPVIMDDDDDDGGPSIPFVFPKPPSTNICAMHNRIYFNDDITYDSMFSLNKELRMMDDKLMAFSLIHRSEPMPIYLHITTYGGMIHAAFSAVDCMKSLRCPIYTVVDGFVASAGTLLSLAGKKRYIQPNAYMLFHELRSGFWGKMSDIDQEYCNLKKVMEHLVSFYTEHSPLTIKQLEKLLTKDSIWSAQECIEKGVVDQVFS